MEETTARAILRLLKTGQLPRGLREIKKRVFTDRANTTIFRTLNLLPTIFKIVKLHTKLIITKEIIDSAFDDVEDLARLNPNQLDYDDLDKLFHMTSSSGSSTKDTETVTAELASESSITDNDINILLYCTSILYRMTMEYATQLQCDSLGGMRELLPLLDYSNSELVKNTVRVITNILQVKGNSLSTFLRRAGPVKLINLLTNAGNDLSMQKAIISSISSISLVSKPVWQAVLQCSGLHRICHLGLAKPELHAITLKVIVQYTALHHHDSVMQLLQGSGDLVVLLRVWQDRREEDNSIHVNMVRIVKQLVTTAVNAVRTRPDTEISGMKCGLVKALFGCKAAYALATEISLCPETVADDVVLALCTLCDGRLESMESGRQGIALAWLQVIDSGGLSTLIGMLNTRTALHSRLFLTLLALEDNYSLQKKVFRHCLTANLLAVLAQHFDESFETYRQCKRAPLNQTCAHKLVPIAATTEADSLTNGPQSPAVVHPFAPISPPASPDDRPPLIYTPYSPTYSPRASPITVCSSSHFLPISNPSTPTISPTFSGTRSASPSPPYSRGCHSPDYSRNGSYSPCSSPSYAGNHSPSYSPILPASFSPTYYPPIELSKFFYTVKNDSPSNTNLKRRRSFSPVTESSNVYCEMSSLGSGASLSKTRKHDNSILINSAKQSPKKRKATNFESTQNSGGVTFNTENQTKSVPLLVSQSSQSIVSDPKSESADGISKQYSYLKIKEDVGYLNMSGAVINENCDIKPSDDVIHKKEASNDSETSTSINFDANTATVSSLDFKSNHSVNNVILTSDVIGDASKSHLKYMHELNINQANISESIVDSSANSKFMQIRDEDIDCKPSISFEECSVDSVKSQNVSDDSTGSNVKLSGVQVREFNHIKFRVGKRNKQRASADGNSAAKNIDNGSVRGKVLNVPLSLPNTDFASIKKVMPHCDIPQRKEKAAELPEVRSLRRLETVVRIISQVCVVEEALSHVCIKFLPRIMLYLRYSQIAHLAAHRMLHMITKTAASIPVLLDTFFPAYVAVQFCELLRNDTELEKQNRCMCESRTNCSVMHCLKTKPEINDSSKCKYCTQFATNGHELLRRMSSYFCHSHKYGECEAHIRLRANAPPYLRETILLNIPHVTECPTLLRVFLFEQNGLLELMNIVMEASAPDTARFMYVTAAFHALAITLRITMESPLLTDCVFCLMTTRKNKISKNDFDASGDLTGYSCASNPTQESTKEEKSNTSSKITIKSSMPEPCYQCQPGNCNWADINGKDIKLVADQKHSDFFTHISQEENNEGIEDFHLGQRSESMENLDDDVVWVHRSVLCAASEVWTTMLGDGGWQESQSDVVKVQGVSFEALRAIVHNLYGCNCSALSNLSIMNYVQILFACDMYGLKQLRRITARQIILNCSSGEDIVFVYSSGVGRIEEDIISAILVDFLTDQNMFTWKRAKWLHSIAISSHAKELLDILFTIFNTALENVTNCMCQPKNNLYMVTTEEYDKLI